MRNAVLMQAVIQTMRSLLHQMMKSSCCVRKFKNREYVVNKRLSNSNKNI